MSLYTLIIVTFVIFMAINVIIGLRGRKHASTTKDFLTASGQSGIWFIIASAVGASIGSGVVIGTTQYAVKLGVAGAWYAIACGLACVVHAFVMTRFIYRNKLVSFSDYFKRRYDSNFIVLLYSGIGPFACAASMGGQLVAAKAIFQAFGINPTIGLVITAAVMLVYTMFAGLWGSYATAVFQVGVIIVGVLVVGISMFTQGGVAEIHAFYPAEKFDLFNISPELWMMFVGPMVLSVLVDQTSGNVKKCAVGKYPKSEKHGNTAQFSEVERSGTQENCGGIGSSCRLRLRPLPVLRRRQSQRVARIDPNAVVVGKNIAENDRFDLFSRQLVRRDLVDLLFLERGKKALHPCVVEAMSGAAEALYHAAARQLGTKS